MCERWDFRRGYGQKLQDTRIDLKITQKARGLTVREGGLLSPLVKNEQRGVGAMGAYRGCGCSNRRGSGQLGAQIRCKTKREDRGDRDGVLTSVGDEREVAGFWMVTDG
jgi:hypothetical protein